MRKLREKRPCYKRSFVTHKTQKLGAQCLGFLAFLAFNAHAEVPIFTVAAPAIKRATATPAPKPQPTPQQAAVRAHVDRMAILVAERNEIMARRVQIEASGDQAAIARIRADLESIDREIAVANKQPIYPVRFVPPPAGGAKPVTVATAAVPESQPAPSEPTTYESWDVFKNFGRKGNQP